MRKNFVFECEDEAFSPENVAALQGAFEGFVKSNCRLTFEFIFVDEAEIQRLNRELRATDKVTDVLSFPALDGIKGKELKKQDYPFEVDEEGNLFMGSIAVCLARAKEQAEEYGHSFERELHYLLVHGVLHCLGYDHMTDTDKAEMREKEEYVLTKLGITRE